MSNEPLFTLEENLTSDKIPLRGIVSWPKNPPKRALVFIHGLGSHFFHQVVLIKKLASQASKSGWAVASFHNRGCDDVAEHRKYDGTPPKGYSKLPGGQAHEVFTDCIYDIQAVVDILKQHGIEQIVLIGHSTGCQKSVYYLGTKPDKAVIGAVLLAPLNDRLGFEREMGDKLPGLIKKARAMVKSGKAHILMNSEEAGLLDAQRFLSLAEKGSDEDVFPYDDPKDPFTTYSKVKIPLLIIIGAKDEYLDRPVKKVLKVLQEKAAVPVGTSVVKQANHGFTDHEQVVVADILGWVQGKFNRQFKRT